MFEMSTGQEPSDYIPTEEDYDEIKDEELKKILKYIFERKTRGIIKKKLDESTFKNTLDEVYA
jgi:hypothetical protein